MLVFNSLLGIMHVKLSKEKWYSFSNLKVIIITTILSLLGFAAATTTLLKVIGVIDLPKN